MAALLPILIDGVRAAIDAGSVIEVLGERPRTRVPDAHPLLPAALAYRGRAVAALDLGLVLGERPALGAATPRRRTVIAAVGASTLAIPVDAAREVELVEDAALVPAPPALGRYAAQAATLDGEAVPILDLGRIVEAAAPGGGRA